MKNDANYQAVIEDLRNQASVLLAQASDLERVIGIQPRTSAPTRLPFKFKKRGRQTASGFDDVVLGIVRDGFDKFPVIVAEAKSTKASVKRALKRLMEAGKVKGVGKTVSRRFEVSKNK